jgi:hypothetical protein
MHFTKHPTALLAAALLAASPAWAGPGHDHGDAAPAAAGPALPRFAAESETFELVGVLNGQQITLYLDRFGDNRPVRGAQIELEIGAAKLQAAPLDDDTYQVVLPEAPPPGVLPVTATVTAGDEADLLAAELDIPAQAQGDEAAHLHSWTAYAGWAAAGIAALGWLVWGGRRFIAARSLRAGAAA